MPEIFTGMRIGIGVGWTTLVAAEMVASTSGLGFMVLTLQHRGNDWAAADLEVKVPPLGRREAHIANPS